MYKRFKSIVLIFIINGDNIKTLPIIPQKEVHNFNVGEFCTTQPNVEVAAAFTKFDFCLLLLSFFTF